MPLSYRHTQRLICVRSVTFDNATVLQTGTETHLDGIHQLCTIIFGDQMLTAVT